VVPVGGLAVRELLGVARVGEAVGRRFPLGDADAIPLPHPSGASGWLNEPQNGERLERALSLLQVSLQRLNDETRQGPDRFG
jgi:uracil-DNA glycosylase